MSIDTPHRTSEYPSAAVDLLSHTIYLFVLSTGGRVASDIAVSHLSDISYDTRIKQVLRTITML